MRDPDDLSDREHNALLRATAQGQEALEAELVALGLSDFDEAASDARRVGPRLARAVVDAIDQRIEELDGEVGDQEGN